MTDIKRYEQFGWDYDHYNPRDLKAEAWYLDHLALTGGPVLEIACGGGKLLEPFARAGYEVTGLDLSDTMLERARDRIDGLPAEIAGRINPYQANKADFDLDRTFATVVLADNSFRELETREELLACARCIRRHLEPGGLFLLTEARFNPDLYPDGRRSWPWTRRHRRPGSSETARRRVMVKILDQPRRLEGLMIYEVTAEDGSVTVEECPYLAPVLTPDEYFSMLAAAGFDTTLCVGYEDRPDDGEEQMLCFVATAVS